MKTMPAIISNCQTRVIMLISISCVVIAFVLNIPFRRALFGYSLNAIHTMQRQTQVPLLTAVHNMVTFYAGTEGTFILMVFIYILSFDKINVVVIVIYICANTFLMAFIKVMFLDPRPYIYPNLVKNIEWKCEITYGFPSGHTWILLLLHQPLITDIIGRGPFNLGLLYTLLLAAFVPWSRMYLGSHSADQLVNGLLYSFAFLVLYRYYFRQKLFKLIGVMLDSTKRMRNFLILIVTHLFLVIPPIILYEINANYRDIDMGQFYLTNQICNKKLNYLQKMGTETSDLAICNIITGFMYGVLLLKQSYGNDTSSIRTIHFLLGFWEFRVSKIKNFLIKKFILYSISIILTAGVIYLLIGIFIQDFYVTYFLKILGWNAMSIIWVRIIPEISIRYKLIQSIPYHKTSMIKIQN